MPPAEQPMRAVVATRARATKAERNDDIVPPFAPLWAEKVFVKDRLKSAVGLIQ